MEVCPWCALGENVQMLMQMIIIVLIRIYPLVGLELILPSHYYNVWYIIFGKDFLDTTLKLNFSRQRHTN